MATITDISGTKGQPAGRVARLIGLLVLLLAFGLRIYHLDWQSLWYDEAQTLFRALTPLSQLAAATPVEHSPTYFALQHFWLLIAGDNDFALRYLSVFPSVCAVALAYRLGADLGSRRAGMVAAVLLATGMFQVWYAQEARMYTWILATSLLATWLLWRLLTMRATDPKSYVLPFLGYVLAVAATIYLHHYGLMLPLAQAVFVLIWLAATRDWRRFALWCGAGACVLVLYLPGATRLLAMLGYSGWQQRSASPARLPWYFLTAYTAGDTMPEYWHAWLPWVYAVLLLAGLYAWWRTNRFAGLLLACTALIPVGAAWLLALTQPQFHERYTMMVTGPLMLLAGNGVIFVGALMWPRKRQAASARGEAATRLASSAIVPLLVSAAILALLLAANGLALQRLYTDAGQQKAGYKQAAQLIAQAEQPGDVILSDVPPAENILSRYYKGGLALRQLPFPGLKDEQQMAELAVQAVAGAQRAWVVEGSGRPGSAKAWLAQHGWLSQEEEFNGLHVSLYGLPGLPELRLPANFKFGRALQLQGAELVGGAQAGSDVVFRAGDLLGVTTAWQASDTLPSLKFRLLLADANGRVWQSTDYVPLAGYAPTERWQPGTTVSDQHGMLLATDLPPGRYLVSMRIYNSETGVAELAAGAEEAALATIQVLPAPVPPHPDQLPLQSQRQVPLNPQLEVLGYGTEPETLQVQGKNTLQVWWRAKEPLQQPYRLRIELANSSDGVIAQTVQPLSAGVLEWWQAGEIVGERYDLPLDLAATAGDYQLQLALLTPDGSVAGQPATVGTLHVQARPRLYQLPTIQHPLQARLGETIALRGYAADSVDGSGRQLKLTLYWQALQRVAGHYKVFIHVLDQAGQVVAQADDFPAGGQAPTESWLSGEVIADTHTIDLPPGGPYRLFAGLYDPESGQRIAAWDALGQQIPDAAIALGETPAP